MELACFVALAVFIGALVKIGQAASNKTSLSSLFPDVDAEALREHRSRLRRKRRRLRDRLEETLVPPYEDDVEPVVEQVKDELPDHQDVLADAQQAIENLGTQVEDFVTGGVAGALGALGIDHALDDDKEEHGAPPEPPKRDEEAFVVEETLSTQVEDVPAPTPELTPEPEPAPPEPEPTPPAVEPVTATTELSDPTDLAAGLFTEGRPGFEVKDVFEKEHLGKRVHWQATIDRVENYYSDSTLGDGPGTRVVTLVETPGDGARRVRIDLGLAKEWAERLERGNKIEFEGELSACDPYLLSFSVKNASVVG